MLEELSGSSAELEALSQSTAKCRSFKDKHLWVKKATRLGVTEFMLRMINFSGFAS
jgi:hypothetical protein